MKKSLLHTILPKILFGLLKEVAFIIKINKEKNQKIFSFLNFPTTEALLLSLLRNKCEYFNKKNLGEGSCVLKIYEKSCEEKIPASSVNSIVRVDSGKQEVILRTKTENDGLEEINFKAGEVVIFSPIINSFEILKDGFNDENIECIFLSYKLKNQNFIKIKGLTEGLKLFPNETADIRQFPYKEDFEMNFKPKK